MSSPALGGVAATSETVIVSDRDPADRVDIFRCFNADGSERWTFRYASPGMLDYGNSPRATPEIHGDLVILAGAHGAIHAVGLADGKIRWKKHLQKDYGGPGNLSWGFCSSPLIVDNQLILNPGSSTASIVALNVVTGDEIWRTAGNPPGHGSFIVFEAAGKKQVVGYDNETLGGWDLATGERQWTLKPRRQGDFNVPTPIAWGDKLIVATENNGTRVYGFDASGKIIPEALSTNEELVPDCHSPVMVNETLFGVSDGLFCLRPANRLKTVWHREAAPFSEYASLIVSSNRLLLTSLKGKLVLASTEANEFKQIGELQLFENEEGLYSHPALVGRRLYVRGTKSLVCVELPDSPN